MPMIGLPPRSSSRRDAVVHVALEIERGHRRIGRIVEPAAAAQPLVGAAFLRNFVILFHCSTVSKPDIEQVC